MAKPFAPDFIERLELELDECKQKLVEETDLRIATQRELEALQRVEAENEALVAVLKFHHAYDDWRKVYDEIHKAG